MDYNKPDHNSRNFVAICKACKVTQLYVFGAAISGNFQPNDILEFYVEINEESPLALGELLLCFWTKMEEYSGHSVNLFTKTTPLNHYMKEQIKKTMKLLYNEARGGMMNSDN